jgi:signal transduction histidine kinase
MRDRLMASTALIALAAVLVLGVPLGVVGARLVRSDANGRLEREADRAAAVVERLRAQGRPITSAALAREVRPGHRVEVLLAGGRLVAAGRVSADDVLRVGAGADPGARVTVIAPAEDVSRRAEGVWLLVAALGGGGVVLAIGLAFVQGRRLARPLERLAAVSARLGTGDFSARASRSGLPEVDAVGTALDTAAARIARLLATERAFSSDVSHQLRTPLTALQLRLEELARLTDGDTREEALEALGQAERLEGVVSDLLALARRERRAAERLDAAEVAREHGRTWAPLFARAGRRLDVDAAQPLSVVASRGGVGQAIDVLLDNALRHGAGVAALSAFARDGEVVLQVSDAGPGVPVERAHEVFERGTGNGSGLGLAVARALVEDDGGRIRLAEPTRARFEVVLPARGE